MKTGKIFDIKEFAAFDGPGVRVTVFFQGCPLRCQWCHNPEGLPAEGGRRVTSEELAAMVRRYQRFWKICEGGVTFSGGEPLLQADFLCETMKSLPDIHKTIETSMCVPEADFQRAAELADFLYVDFKLYDPVQHRRYTGADNRLVFRNLAWLSQSGFSYTVRVPLIPGVTDTEENLERISGYLSKFSPAPRVELLPYNEFTKAKYDQLGIPYQPDFQPARPVRADSGVFLKKGVPCTVM